MNRKTMLRRSQGITLPEMLVVIAIISMVMVTLILFILQNNRLYLRTSVHLEPQASQMLTIKRMERELREGMEVINSPDPATWVTVILPIKDETTGFNKMADPDSTTGKLRLYKNVTDDSKPKNPIVHYFLGTKVSAISGKKDYYVAQASNSGDCIFRSETMPGSTETFSDARLIAEGVLNPPLVPDPNYPGRLKQAMLFEYFPYPPDQQTSTNWTRIIKVTLTTPIPIKRITTAQLHIVWKGAWVPGTAYLVNDTVSVEGVPYICRAAHGATSDNQPGIGKNWESYWDPFAEHSLATQFELRNLGLGQ